MKRQILRAGITCLSILCTPVFAQLRGPGTLVFTTSSATVREDAGAIKVSVARINGSRGVVTVNVSTVSGSAIAGQDFVPVNQTLTFANGDAGPRVIKATVKIELPPGFQTSEFLQAHGFVDRIIHRANLRSELARIIDYCGQ